MSDRAVRLLLGDLAVVVHDLAARGGPRLPAGANTRGRFDPWYGFGQPLFHLAIEAGIACEGLALDPSELAPLVEAMAARIVLEELLHRIEGVFDYIGYEYGFLYGVQDWAELAICASAFRFLRELVPGAPDPAELEALLARWGHELYKPLEVPAGMPARHWWWFGDAPPR